jgi:hypothetical protein
MKYKNILLLEDDCIFSTDIRDEKVQQNLNIFLAEHASTSFTYRIGCLPVLLNPFLTHAPYGFYLGLHAYVISEKARQVAIENQANILDMDEYINILTTQYTYYKPLAYQLYPETENQKYWGYTITLLPHFITQYIPYVSASFIKAIYLDKSVYPGYAIMFTLSKILYSLLILLAFFLVYKGIQWVPFLLRAMKPLRNLKGRKTK